MNNDFFQGNDGFTSGTTTYITQRKVNNLKRTKRSKIPFIISGVIILAAVITTAVFFLLSNSKKSESQVEKLTKEIISALQQTDLATFKNHLYPALLEYYIDHDTEDGMIAYTYMSPFLTPGFEFLDYTVKSEKESNDNNTFPVLASYPSYMKPLDYTQVEVEISYEGQKASVYFKYLYCGDRYYIYDVDDSEYDIDFSDYKFSNTITSDEVSGLFASNTMTIEGEQAGERVSFDGYSLVVPENWSSSTTYGACVYSNADSASISIDTDPTFASGEETFFKTLVDGYRAEGFVTTDAGTFKTDNLTGYYLDLYLMREQAFDTPTNMTLVIYPKDGVAYSLFILRYIKGDAAWEEAMKVAASFKFE